MVAGISGSSAGTASSYLKSVQSGTDASAQKAKGTTPFGSEDKAVEAKKPVEDTRNTDTRDSTVAQAKTTELETRNDNETIETEQQRGSLLDLAV